MPNLYDTYKPFRNRLRQYNLTDSLQDIWLLSRHIIDKGPAPFQARVKLNDYIRGWDIELMARELILNAQDSGTKRLNTFEGLATVYNGIRDFENEIAKIEPGLDGAMNVLHRTIHRQFPWQRRRILVELTRYMKIFGADEVDGFLRETLDLGIREFYFIGMAVAGHMVKYVGIDSAQNYEHFKIDANRTQKFFKKISCSVEELRQRTREKQSYDEHWASTWNPLVATPLVSLDPKHPTRLHCPIPDLVLRRISQGLYYDLYAVKGFDQSFGNAFQAYIGELCSHVFKAPRFQLTGESPYIVGGQTHHGTDWILNDESGNIFVECKTKRLRLDAKGSLESPSLAKELGLMADAIVQLHKNIKDAVDGYCHWRYNQLPIHPVVVTLENWYIFGTPLHEQLVAAVKQKLRAAQLPEGLADEVGSCSVWSAEDLENVAGVIASVGIQQFFSKAKKTEYRGWMIRDIVRDAFPKAEAVDMRNIFVDEWKAVLPEADFPEADE